ncbi:MAG: flagellar hook-associated protein FlgK, partial [bacterium]
MDKGNEALQNSRVAVDVTGHNISNANVDGYSRQQIHLESKHPVEHGVHVLGDGARIQSIARSHDRFLESQIRREIQNKHKQDGLQMGLSRLEDIFNPDLNSTIRDRISFFQNSLRELSNYPEEHSVRINVAESAQALTQSFHNTSSSIIQTQQDASEQISLYADDLSQKLLDVARLNGQIREVGAGMLSDANDLEDKRDKLIREIAEMIDVRVYKDNKEQIVIRGPNESLLVEGSLSSRVFMNKTSNTKDFPKLYISEFDKSEFQDVTAHTKNGKIGALMEVRDHYAQDIRNKIDEMAYAFGNRLNEIHALGYGTNEYRNLSGRMFFSGIDSQQGAAQDIQVDSLILEEPSSIGTGISAYAMGDNVVVNQMIRLMDEPIFEENTSSVSGLYDTIVAKLGVDSSKADQSSKASDIVFQKLKTQREAVSGVSLDEEASNLLKFQ